MFFKNYVILCRKDMDNICIINMATLSCKQNVQVKLQCYRGVYYNADNTSHCRSFFFGHNFKLFYIWIVQRYNFFRKEKRISIKSDFHKACFSK